MSLRHIRELIEGHADDCGYRGAMCHDEDSRPPSPPVVGAVLDHGLLTLPAADGNTFAAYQAMPAQGSDKAVVILPDVRGLNAQSSQLVSASEAANRGGCRPANTSFPGVWASTAAFRW
jgi:hypothetical protein